MSSPPGRRKMATIQDIASDLGLSAMTVSRALNGHPDVKKETGERVLKRAQELNYRPNRWARSLVTQRSQMIGVVIPEISHTFFADIVAGVQQALADEGYTLILCHSGGSAADEEREIDMLAGSRADGLIVASAREQDDDAYFERLRNDGLPFVLIDRYFPGLDCPRVRTDDAKAAQICARRLIELGHRRIGFISGPNISPAQERFAGFRRSLEEAGLELSPDDVAASDMSVEGGRQAALRLLGRGGRPTAIAAVNDPAAMGVVQAARELGLTVPNDMSVTGIGRIENDYLPTPFLTTALWSREEMGREAARMLLALIEGEELASNDVVIEPSLAERLSTAPPPETA